MNSREGNYYAEATRLLVDTAAAAALANRKGACSTRLAGFRKTHARRPALIRRLDAQKLRQPEKPSSDKSRKSRSSFPAPRPPPLRAC